GESWRATDSGLAGNRGFWGGLAIDARNSQILYATFGDRVFKSTDGAASWRPATSGLPVSGDFPQCCRGGVVIDPTNSNTVYASGSNFTNLGIFRSTNGGANWNQVGSLGARGLSSLVTDARGGLYAS